MHYKAKHQRLCVGDLSLLVLQKGTAMDDVGPQFAEVS